MPLAGRANRRSRTLSFVISRELLEDFQNLSDDHKAQVRNAVLRMMADASSNFDPNHVAHADEAPPVVEYVISSDIRIRKSA